MTSTPAARLRQLINHPDGLLLPGAANALTARIIEDLGFSAVYLTGAGVTNTYLGLPDLGFVSVTEMAAHVAAICEVVDLPLMVDADTGYGNAVNLGRAVRVLERAGAAAIQIEDQVAPKKCGHFDGQEVISGHEMAQKIHAATDARRDVDTVIVARTDARAAHGLISALDRAAAYAEAGADVLFIEGLRDIDELRAAGAAVPGTPKLANLVEGGKTPLLPRADLHELGFAIVLYANAALQGAVHGTTTVLAGLREHGSLGPVLGDLTPWAQRQRLVRRDRYQELEERYQAE
ncbi:MAG TPA: oxaloacetate decarboxylase [Pseudonocardiaceae bacterium]|nr:oxaloacetate decarboxylase [Pseudonocardiaceae bacterium]